MQHQRILVLGCCGSGKSTFARLLGALTGLPVVHLDRLYWKPGWTEPAKEEFYPILQDALSKDAWIMDGNYGRTLPMRLPYCDQVIYFELPRIKCMWGILSRVVKNYGRTRTDIGEGCPEKIDWNFVKYTWNFEKNQGTPNKVMIRDSGKPVVTFHSRRDAKRYLEEVRYDDASDR